MRSSDRGVEHVGLDHLDWAEEGTPHRDSGRERRSSDRRRSTAAAAPGRRRSADRRASGRGAPGGGGVARDRRAPAPKRTARRSSPAMLAPGVPERRALMLVTFLLVAYGLVMAYSASAAQAYFQYGSSFYFFGRQIAWAGIGVGAMWFLSRVDYAWYRRAAPVFAGLVLAALVAVLIPGIGTSINGARRWLMVGGQGVQPSEFAKLAAVMLVATLIVRRPGRCGR